MLVKFTKEKWAGIGVSHLFTEWSGISANKKISVYLQSTLSQENPFLQYTCIHHPLLFPDTKQFYFKCINKWGGQQYLLPFLVSARWSSVTCTSTDRPFISPTHQPLVMVPEIFHPIAGPCLAGACWAERIHGPPMNSPTHETQTLTTLPSTTQGTKNQGVLLTIISLT